MCIRDSSSKERTDPIELPVFDKSAHSGYGDRAPTTVCITPPVDVVIFEGWCLGFKPIPDDQLARSVKEAGVVHPANVMQPINDELRAWERDWYPLIDAYVQLLPGTASGPARWDVVYTWRLQAEHAMKAANGGHGMSDEAVHAFVERYMPCLLYTSDAADE